MAMNRIFRGFCINRFGIGPLNYISRRSHFGFKFKKTTPRLNDTGVGDSPDQRYAESATLRLSNTGSRRLSASLIRGVDDSPHHRYEESAIKFCKRKLAVSVIRRVFDSAYQWCGESSTPSIDESESRRLRVSLSRGVDNSAYWWYWESLFEKK